MSHPFAHKLGATHSPNRQDLVFVRPPDQPASGARLSMESVWFCKVLLIFTFQSRTDSGIKEHKCAFVSVLWEYEGAERPGSNYFQLFIITFNCLYFLYFQHGSTIASLLSFMSNMLEKKSFTCCLWRIFLARLPLCLWDLQAQSHFPCGAMHWHRTLWMSLSIAQRGLEMVAGGGILTRGPWAGRARHKATRRPPR